MKHVTVKKIKSALKGHTPRVIKDLVRGFRDHYEVVMDAESLEKPAPKRRRSVIKKKSRGR